MRNKVIEFVIEPLVDWFNKDLTDGQIKVYSEVLGKYSPDILMKSMKVLKETWAKPRVIPLPANIREICDSLIPRSKPLTVYERANLNFWDAAEQIMPTAIGKLAIGECWARSLVCEVMISGKIDFSDDDIQKFRKGRDKISNVAKTLRNDDPEEKLLLNLWWTMQEKEQQLIDRYCKLT